MIPAMRTPSRSGSSSLACIDRPEGVTADTLQAAIGDFYENEFGELGADVKPNPAAARAIEALVAKGYPLVLATMRCSLAAPWSGACAGPASTGGVLAHHHVRELHRRQA